MGRVVKKIKVLEMEGLRWKNIENGHVEYGLENALVEIFDKYESRIIELIPNEVVYLIVEESL